VRDAPYPLGRACPLPHFKEVGWSWGCVSAIDSNGRTIWIADAHRGDGKRFAADAARTLSSSGGLELGLRVGLGNATSLLPG
jgi:hypothetical protein